MLPRSCDWPYLAGSTKNDSATLESRGVLQPVGWETRFVSSAVDSHTDEHNAGSSAGNSKR